MGKKKDVNGFKYRRQGSIDDENFLMLAHSLGNIENALENSETHIDVDLGDLSFDLEDTNTELKNIKNSIDNLSLTEKEYEEIKNQINTIDLNITNINEKLQTLDGEISELNSDLSTFYADLTDILLWTYNQAESSVTINANSSYDCRNATSIPDTPSGYKRLTYIAGGSGAACVLPSGFGSAYVYNASSNAVTYTPRIFALFVRDI